MAEVERPELDADESRDFQTEPLHQPLYFAVLAFLERDAGPGMHPFTAFEIGNHRTVLHTVDGDPGRQLVEILLRHLAEQAGEICALPTARRQFEPARQLAIIGEEEKAFRIEV